MSFFDGFVDELVKLAQAAKAFQDPKTGKWQFKPELKTPPPGWQPSSPAQPQPQQKPGWKPPILMGSGQRGLKTERIFGARK